MPQIATFLANKPIAPTIANIWLCLVFVMLALGANANGSNRLSDADLVPSLKEDSLLAQLANTTDSSRTVLLLELSEVTQNNYKVSEKYIEQTIELASTYRQIDYLLQAYLIWSKSFFEQSKLEKSLKKSQIVLRLGTGFKSNIYAIEAYKLIFDYYVKKQNQIEAANIAHEALIMAQKSNLPQWVAYFLEKKGSLFLNESDVSEALKNLLKAHLIYDSLGLDFEALQALQGISEVFLGKEGSTSKLGHLFNKLHLARATNDTINIYISLYDLGKQYRNIGQNQKAINYFSQALHLIKAKKDLIMEAVIYNDLGAIEKNLGNYEKALSLHKTAQKMSVQLHRPGIMATANLLMGMLYVSKGDYNKALLLLNQTIDYRLQISDHHGIAEGMYLKAKVFFSQRQDEKALNELKEATEHALQVNSVKVLHNIYELKAQIYSYKGNYKKAFELMKKYTHLHDSLSAEIRKTALTDVKTAVALQKQKHENQLLKKNNELQKIALKEHGLRNRLLLALSIFLVLSGSIITLMYWQRRKKHMQISQQASIIAEKNQEIEIWNTRLTKQNRKLEQLMAEKNRFVSLVSHDLKSPLSQIYSLSQLIEEDTEKLNSDQKQFIAQVKSIVISSTEMINDLLNAEAYENDKIELNLEPTQLNTFIREIAARHNSYAKSKDIKIFTEFDTDVTEMPTDRRFLNRIIDNLINNAIKFSDFGKNVFISTIGHNDYIKIGVRDEGPGLSQTDLTKLFQKFGKLSNRPTGSESSSGLGLYMVKMLAEKLGGNVKCDSEVGKGSTFWVILPKNFNVVE